MDTHEAGRLLSVAAHEIVEVRQDAEGWWALHHDMASHVQVWRHIPGWQLATGGVISAPPADSEEPVGDTDGDGVPDGGVAEVLDWVGDDRDRAVRALEAEQRRDKPRTTLVTALEKLAG